MKRIIIIDIGTNSIKFLKASAQGSKVTIKKDINVITRMGEGLHESNIISDNAIQRNFGVLKKLLNESKEFEPDYMIATGTMWLRKAKNSEELLEKAKKELRLDIKLLSGKEEARYSYLGAISNMSWQRKEIMVFDIGGGSTEIIKGRTKEIREDYSFNFGAVDMTEKFLCTDPVKTSEINVFERYIKKEFNRSTLKKSADKCIGMGGTVTTLGAIKHKMEEYGPEKIQDSILHISEIEKQIELFKQKTIKQRKKIIGLHPQRAEVILAGTIIAKNILTSFNFDRLKISNRGLRHGILYEKIK